MRSHYSDVIMGALASQITSLTIVYSTVYSDTDQRKHQSSASLAFVRGIHRGPVNSPHKWLVTRKMFPFDDVIWWRNAFRTIGPLWRDHPIPTPTLPPPTPTSTHPLPLPTTTTPHRKGQFCSRAVNWQKHKKLGVIDPLWGGFHPSPVDSLPTKITRGFPPTGLIVRKACPCRDVTIQAHAIRGGGCVKQQQKITYCFTPFQTQDVSSYDRRGACH